MVNTPHATGMRRAQLWKALLTFAPVVVTVVALQASEPANPEIEGWTPAMPNIELSGITLLAIPQKLEN
eukprot:4131508-Amphidinium_carterae.1